LVGRASRLGLAWILIRGKGNKERRCPLWERTVAELASMVQGRCSDDQSLAKMGLGGMQKISDAQGTKIRGTPKSYWPTRQWIYVIPLLF
jgi:site-specific recombinase XerC